MIKKHIAIIQMGEAIEEARIKYGDFDQWFIEGMDISRENTKTYRVFENLEFPEKQDIAGIIISGSSAMVTDELIWSEATIKWLKPLIDSSIPLIGVCYGHQLLSKLLGGKVDWNPKGRAIGQVELHLTSDVQHDQLLGDFTKKQIELIASHQQIVVQLPQNVTLLGATKLDSHHCFRYKEHIWGLQFHPEFTADIIIDYIKARSKDISAEGLNPLKIIENIKNNTNGKLILHRFKKLCGF